MIHLSGIVEEIFGSSIVLRGYTTLKNLVDISERPDYQRKEDGARLKEIEKYIKGTSFRFFPELLFGWQLGIDNFISRIREEKKDTIILSANVSLLKKKFKFEKGKETVLKVVDVKIKNPENFLRRIDGNHRLCAIEEILADNPDVVNEYGNIVVPFSILMHPKSIESDKKEAAFFYLINSKAKSLTDEQNLKSIFVGDRFDEIEKKNLAIVSDVNKFEKIAKTIVDGDYSFVSEIFNNEAFTLALKVFDNIGNDTTVSSIKKGFIQIEALFASDKLTNKNKNIIISLIVAYAKHGNNFFEGYNKWLIKNQLSKIENVQPKELLSSFEELRKNINVFVAMPYFGDERISSASASFKKVFKDIQEKYGIPIQLIDNDDIMTYEGQTLDIVDSIMDKINRCSIFVCDITDNNPNVTYEFGRAAALGKPIIVLREKDSCEPKSDFSRYYYEKYDKTAHLTYERAIEKHILACLKKDFHFDSII